MSSVVVITIGGVDITEHVVFATARFESKVNGQPGEAYMRVRDLDSTYSVTEGADWLVTIDGDAAWRGYVTQKIDTYIYDAGNVGESGLQRFFDLRGADLNLLFSQRIVFKKADPTVVAGTQYAAGTPDTTAITELVTNWLDLSSDDLDTTTGIVGVGDLDPSQPTRAWSGGWQWGQAMTSIATIPAAIFYIRPEVGSPRGTLVYCDVDVPDAPFGLADVVIDDTYRGYREMEITLDGTSLANDVMCWGMGYGSQRPVFKRARDTTSITQHGVWQTGRIVPGVYKQGTINRIADSILNGSPESRRGAKDDRPSVRLVTYAPGLLAGHKVPFTSAVWNWSDVIPVRQMAITFESPTDPKYEILLSHEIDSPWGFIDQFWPEIPGIPVFCPDPPCAPCLTCGQPDDACDCGITDDFEGRTVASGLGTATCGLDWTGTTFSASASVSGGHAILSTPGGGSSSQTSSVLGPGVGHTVAYEGGTRACVFTFSSIAMTASDLEFDLSWIALVTGATTHNIRVKTGSSLIRWGGGGGTSIPDGFWSDASTYTWTQSYDAGTGLITGTISDGSTSYSSTFSFTPVSVRCTFSTTLTQVFPFTASNKIVYLESMDIPEITRCTLSSFDDFERTITTGWGSATPSAAVWTQQPQTHQAPTSVSGGYGIASLNATSTAESAYMWTASPTTGAFTCTILWGVGVVPTGPSDAITMAITFGGSVFGLDFGAQMTVSNDHGQMVISGDTTDSAPKTDWTTSDYYTEIAWDGNDVLELRTWLASGTRPATADATASFAGPLSSTLFAFSFASTTTGSAPVRVGDIAFGYADAPCYYDCSSDGLMTIDDFNRTVASGWGTSFPTLRPWTQGLVTAASVGGGYGQMTYTSLDSPTAVMTLDYGLRLPSTVRVLWYLDLAGGADDPTVAFINANVILRAPGGVSSGWYWSEVLVESTGFQWKSWVDGGSVPGSYTDSYSTTVTTAKPIVMLTGNGVDLSTLRVQSIVATGCSPVASTAAAPPQGVNGYGCEDATRVSSTDYTTSGRFALGSTFVWRDGLFQRRGTDYTEGSDLRTLTFSDAVASTSSIRVCYFTEVQP